MADGVTTNVERTEGEANDSLQSYSNTPSTPGGMRKSLVMPMVDFTQQGTWVLNSPAVGSTPEGLSSSVESLDGQSPVDTAQVEGGYIFRPLSTVMEVPSASPTPAPQLLPKLEEKPVPASLPEEAAPVPEPLPAAEASEAEEYSHSDNDEEHSQAVSSTHLTPPSTLRKLSAQSLKTLKKKQAAERRLREEEEAQERERRGSVASLQERVSRSRQGSEVSILAAGNKQTMSTFEAAPMENPVAHAPAPPPAATDPHLDKSSAAADGTTTSLHPTILHGSSIAPSSEAEAADKDEPVGAQQKLESEAQAQASSGVPDAEAVAPIEDQEGARLKKNKSGKGRKGAGKGAEENIDTAPPKQAIISAERDIATVSATQDRAIETLVTLTAAAQGRNETEKAGAEAIARDEQLPTEFAENNQFIEEPESFIADIPAELPPIPEDEPLTDLPPPPPAPIDATGEDILSRSGSKKKKPKSRRSSAISLAEELEAAEEVADTATSSVHNTRPNSPTPSEDSFIVGDDAGSGGEPKIQRSGSKKKKKSGSQRRKERALKRASLSNLQQASQDAEYVAEKKPESIELPPQVPVENFKNAEQSDNTAGGGVKLDAGTPFFEKTEKESASDKEPLKTLEQGVKRASTSFDTLLKGTELERRSTLPLEAETTAVNNSPSFHAVSSVTRIQERARALGQNKPQQQPTDSTTANSTTASQPSQGSSGSSTAGGTGAWGFLKPFFGGN
ncbi:hypothetical protein EV426DRAFT_75617 [Tirmania nivea]|nr:hypothetical protein EV426DRAFT_75617 [Tirmania nivea]